MNLNRLHRVAPGGYSVQYADTATGQLQALAPDVRDSLTSIMKEVAVKDPYAYGPPSLDPDRRVLDVHGMNVTYVISSPEVRMVTVLTVEEA